MNIFGNLFKKKETKEQPKRESKRRIQHLKVYIRGYDKPFDRIYEVGDCCSGGFNFSWASDEAIFNSLLDEYLSNRAKQGILMGRIWYSPESIERIEIGESKLETIKEEP